MIARFSLSVLLAACVVWPSGLSAQWAPPGADPSIGYGPPGGPIQTAGGYAPCPDMEYCPDDSGYGGAVYQTKPLPWERDGDSAFRKFIKEVVPNTYFRVEYLNWNVDDIGSGKIGSGTLRTTDPLGQIANGVFNLDSYLTRGLVTPSTEPITFEKTSGLRATFGIPLTFGALEFSGFALENNQDFLRNAIPSSRRIGDFTVPGTQILIIPPTIAALTFPLGTIVVTPQPGQRVFFPGVVVPGTPPTPVTQITNAGDLVFLNTTFNVLTQTAVGIPLSQNNATSLTTLIYDVSYNATYDSDIWGTEAKVILDYGPNHNGLTVKPLVGFRYMTFDERFKQVGVTSLASNIARNAGPLYVSPDPAVFLFPIGPAVNGTSPSPRRTSVIDSQVDNSLYGLQLGTRAEYDSKWFSLGVEPRISLGLNSYEAQVTTSNLRSFADGVRRTTEEETIFAPIFDLSMYGKVHVTPHFSLHAGYNFTYLFQVSRPAANIVYNDNGAAAPPGVVVDAQTHDVHIQGLTVGGEFRFRDLKFH